MQYKNKSFESLMELVKEKKIGNVKFIEKTYNFVEKHYKEKKRESGAAFITHLLNVAYQLAEMDVDAETISSGLAHDFLDESFENKKILEKETSKTVARIVEEVANIDQVVIRNRGKIATKNLTNVLLANARDVRTLLVELSAALDNLRHMENIKKEKQRELAEVADEIYVPLAHKLGLYFLEWEINDLSFKILKPKEYYNIKKALNEKRKTREETIELFIKEIEGKLKEKNIDALIYGRAKSFAGIYNKMQKQNKKLEELMDLLALRIICNSVGDCYTILGIIHANYKLLPHHFDDYIANPKPNNYRSLHTVIEWNKKNIEIQIRTYDMHYDAEEGMASHWQYKEFKETPYFDKKLTWAKQLVNWQQKNPSMLKNFNIDLSENRIFVFTPKKQVIMLPEKASPLDFAFALHTQLGFLCKKALVNGKPVALDYELKNGDSVEIVKSPKAGVKKSWLGFVKTEKAKTKIRKKLGIPQKTVKMGAIEKYSKVADENAVLAKCCNPLPEDEVFGYRTTKRKITLHRIDCANKKNLKKENIIDVKLGKGKRDSYRTKISINALDDPKVLEKILKILALEEVTIKSTSSKYSKNNIMKTEFEIIIKNLIQLKKLMAKIGKTPGIMEVKRI